MTRNPIHRSGLLLLAMLTPLAPLRAEDDSPRELLRDALYAEEVTRDPAKAAEHYQKVLELYEGERPFAATALFRLAEVRRKQGNKEDAAKLYQRLLRDFPTAEVEGKLARENLVAMGGAVPDATAPAGLSDEESKELQRLQELVRTSPDLARDPMLLEKAARAGQLRVMTLLIDSGIDPKPDYILIGAAASGNLKAVELLLAKRDPGTPPTGWALKQAVESGYQSIAALLLKSGAKADFRYEVKSIENGFTPTTTTLLHLAAGQRDEQMCRLLLDQGADLNFMPEFCFPTKGFSNNSFPVGAPLHQAIDSDTGTRGSLPAMLMKAGAKPDRAASASGLTPLHIAASKGSLPVMRALLEAGVAVDPRSTLPEPIPTPSRGGQGPWHLHEAGKTPLHYAIGAGSEEAVRLLLSKKADPNAVTKSGLSTISHALSLSSPNAPAILKLLVDAGAKVSSPDEFVTAANGKSPEVVELLLGAGADVNAISPRYKKAPLEAAVAARNSPQIVRLLIDRGAKADDALLGMPLGDATDEIREIVFDRFLLPELLSKPAVTLLFSKGSSFRRNLATREGDLPPAALEALLLKAEQLPFVDSAINLSIVGPDGRIRGSGAVFPQLVTIYRKEAGGGIRKVPARLDGSVPLPKLEWGDVVQLKLDPESFEGGIPQSYNVSYHGVVSPELFWNLRKHLSVPITAHIDGQARKMTLRGDCLVYYPGEPVAPLLRANWLAQVLWSRLAPDYLTIRRAGWPEIRIVKDNAEWEKFEFQPGDEVIPGYKEDPAALTSKRREGTVSLSIPGTGFGKSWWATDPRTVPTLVEMITDTYAAWPRNSVKDLPENAEERWGEMAAGQQGDSMTTRQSNSRVPYDVLTIPQYPDLSKIRLLRKAADGQETVQEIDLTKAIATTTEATSAEEARRGDVQLQAGDLVELSLEPQGGGQPWPGFNAAEVRFFSKVLGGTFQFSDRDGNLSRKNLVWQPVKWLPSPSGPVPFPPDMGVASTASYFEENMGSSAGILLTRGVEEERRLDRSFFIRDGDQIRMGNGAQPINPGQVPAVPAVRPPRQRIDPPQPRR